MKDNRFTELVNLYIDRQITAAESAELEAEIQADPRRRAIYHQYCQMHRATKLVYDSFRAPASDQPPGSTASPSVIARFESQQRDRKSRWAYYAGGLAVAACLTLVFVRLNPAPDQTVARSLMVANNSGPAPQADAVVPPVATASAPVPTLVEPLTGPVSLRNNAEPDYAALLAALRQEEQRAMANGQIHSARTQSLFDDGVFDSRQVLPATNQRVFRGRQTPAAQVEFTAFQFQR